MVENGPGVADVLHEKRDRLVGFVVNELRSWGITDPDLAQDIVQDASLRAWKKEKAGTISHYESYLYAVIRNRVKDVAKHKRPALYPDMEILDSPAVPLCDVEARVDQVNALRTLPADAREGIYRVLALGETHQEAAATMSRSPGTVASWIRRNRTHLAAMLGVVACAVFVPWACRLPSQFSTEPGGWATPITRLAKAVFSSFLQPWHEVWLYVFICVVGMAWFVRFIYQDGPRGRRWHNAPSGLPDLDHTDTLGMRQDANHSQP